MHTTLRIMCEVNGVIEAASVLDYPSLKLSLGIEGFIGGSVSGL